MANAESNAGPRTAQGTITQADLLDAKFMEWQARHAQDFFLDPMHEQSRFLQAAICLQRKLEDGFDVAPGLLAVKRRRANRTSRNKAGGRSGLAISVTDAPGKWRADVEPAGAVEESNAEQFDPERDELVRKLAFGLARMAAQFCCPEKVAEIAEQFHVTPEQLLSDDESEELDG